MTLVMIATEDPHVRSGSVAIMVSRVLGWALAVITTVSPFYAQWTGRDQAGRTSLAALATGFRDRDRSSALCAVDRS
jgi:hypothetical protein